MKIKLVVPIALAAVLSGCVTSTSLKESTIATSGTLNSIEFAQVLQNVDAFYKNPDSLPWAVDVVGGTITINDQANLGLSINSPPTGGPTFTPSANGQRGWSEGWTTTPVADGGHLLQIQRLYRWSVGIYDEYRPDGTIVTHNWKNEAGTPAKANWIGANGAGAYRETLSRAIQTNGKGNPLPQDYLPDPNDPWFTTSKPTQPAVSCKCDGVTIWVDASHLKYLTGLCFYLGTITSDASGAKNFLIGGQIH